MVTIGRLIAKSEMNIYWPASSCRTRTRLPRVTPCAEPSSSVSPSATPGRDLDQLGGLVAHAELHRALGRTARLSRCARSAWCPGCRWRRGARRRRAWCRSPPALRRRGPRPAAAPGWGSRRRSGPVASPASTTGLIRSILPVMRRLTPLTVNSTSVPVPEPADLLGGHAGLEPEPARIDHGEERRADLHHVARVHRPVAHHAVERRADPRVPQLLLGGRRAAPWRRPGSPRRWSRPAARSPGRGRRRRRPARAARRARRSAWRAGASVSALRTAERAERYASRTVASSSCASTCPRRTRWPASK